MGGFASFTSGETCAHGPIRNPRVDGATPGGSSSGSDAAVAAGEVDGRPVGFQAVAGYDDEATAVRVGSAVEGR
jgi:Asp-tRNA(Asn)/Glu-tRNA(Gln) amidotransferase A subunit family amidase